MDFKIGDKVRMKTNNLHKYCPEFYPDVTIIGTVVMVGVNMLFVD